MIRRPPPDLVVTEDLDGFEVSLVGDPRLDSAHPRGPLVAAILAVLLPTLALLLARPDSPWWMVGVATMLAVACGVLLRVQLARAKVFRITANALRITQRTRPEHRVPLASIGRCNVHPGPQLWLRIAGQETLRLDVSDAPMAHATWLASEIEAAARGARERNGDRARVPQALERLR